MLNKFSAGHNIFKQQLDHIKDKKVDFIEEKRDRDNLEKKNMLRKMQKGYGESQNLNDIQRKQLQRQADRAKLYGNNSNLMVNITLRINLSVRTPYL
jgi:hypothetical protein